MPHAPVQEHPELQPDQRNPGSEGIWRASHRFDCKTATADVGKRVSTKEHQIRIAVINPEQDLKSAVRILELHASDSILVPLKVGERMVEHGRTDPP